MYFVYSILCIRSFDGASQLLLCDSSQETLEMLFYSTNVLPLRSQVFKG